MLSIINIIQLIGFTLLMSMGQLLFKKTAMTITNNSITEATGLLEGIIRALQIPWLYAALLVYALATMLWLYILQRIPLPYWQHI